MKNLQPILALSLSAAPAPAVLADTQKPIELDSVLVTAPLQQKPNESAIPVTVLDRNALNLKMGRSIGETLSQELGMTSQSFGPGVGTPVIRGQAGPRVRVLNNGVGANDVSAISPDHATSIEPLLADRIEVLRGPATLLYGSGAIGGVVNVIDNRIPGAPPDKPIGGAVEQRYDSVADETSTALRVDGGHAGVALHLDGFYRERNNLSIGGRGIDIGAVAVTDPSIDVVQNPRGFLPNTWAHTIGGSAGLSWVGDRGFAGAAINRLENNYGIAPNGAGEETVRIDLRQTKYDFKSELRQPFGFAKAVRAKLGYTDYQHTEIANGEPGAFFTNQSYEGRLELDHEDIGPLRGQVGFQAIASDFSAIEKLSGEAIVPRSQINNYGVFAVEAFDLGPVTYQFGTRVEHASVAPQGQSELSYVPVSASASGLWKIDTNNSVNLALTRSARAPQVQELLANGYHDATRSFEVGDRGLREEVSYNLDLGYRFRNDWLRAEFDLFHNWASDYIFQQRTGQFVDEEGNPCAIDCAPVVRSAQGDAIFKGYEAKLGFTLLESHYGIVDLTLFSDYTRGEFTRGGNVPRMPPLRYGLQIDHALVDWNSYLRVTRAEDQPFGGDNETPTPGYVLLNVGTQYQVRDLMGAQVMLFAKGNNLLNENIRNATSYLRNFAPEAGRGAEVGVRVSY